VANTYSPFGLQSFGRMEGGSPTAGLTTYLIASSDPNPVFCGDLVKDSTNNFKYITWQSTGQTGAFSVGVFAGCEYYSPSVGRVVWSRFFPGAVQTSGPDVKAYVYDDPNQLFIIQASTGDIVGSSQRGFNFAVLPTSQGNTTTGQSALALQSSIFGSTNTYPVRLVDVYANHAPPGSPNIDSTYAQVVVVAPNNWDRRNLTSHST
jgi:hypothetical protein